MTDTNPRQEPGSTGGASRRRHLAGVLLCLLAAGLALLELRHWQRNHDELLGLLEEAGLATPGAAVVERLRREPTPHHAQVLTARALVHGVIASGGEAAAERLSLARGLARRVLEQQPDSWQGAMLFGASTYLERSLASERRLFTAASDWEEPLLQATRIAAGKAEPRRFLAAAYLEVWAALSPEKKRFATGLLKDAFRDDPLAFEQLSPFWLQVAADREQAFALIPDRPQAWRQLTKVVAGELDWDAYVETHRRYLDALERHLQQDLDEARERRQLGDFYNSRALCLRVLNGAPVDGRFVPVVERALEIFPPGLYGRRSSPTRISEWLRWALELDTLGMKPFSPRILGRLHDAIGELPAHEAAHAALIAGDDHGLRRYQGQVETKSSDAWIPFMVARAHHSMERREWEPAAATLKEIGLGGRLEPIYWSAYARLARGHGGAEAFAEAELRLSRFQRREWDAQLWRRQGSRVRLRLLPAQAARGLVVELTKVPPDGTVIEVVWDGSAVALEAVRAPRLLELELAVEPRLHWLEIRTLAGNKAVLGPVRLLTAP